MNHEILDRGASDHLGTCYTPGLIKYGTSCILRRPGEFGYRGWQAKRKGERRRIKLKGCILDRNLRAVSAIIIRKGALGKFLKLEFHKLIS